MSTVVLETHQCGIKFTIVEAVEDFHASLEVLEHLGGVKAFREAFHNLCDISFGLGIQAVLSFLRFVEQSDLEAGPEPRNTF